MRHIAYQLYCSRKFPPLVDTLQMLADIGYREVEAYGALFDDVEALKDGLNRAGLGMPSAHIALTKIESEPEGVVTLAHDLAIRKIFVPAVAPTERPTDADGWRAFATRLHAAGRPIREAGLTFGWHNHDFELADLGSTTPLDLIAEAGVSLELDLGWVKVAGHDPVALIEKYADRIAAVHIKDIARDGEGEDEDGWADVGHGTMDWPGIIAALDRAGIDHLVIEHDNPSDHRRFAANSYAAVSNF